MDRKSFFKTACFTGACFCGLGRFSGFAQDTSNEVPDPNKELKQDWLAELLMNLGQDLDEDTLRKVIKKSAVAHYEQLNMDAMLADYKGDLEGFNAYIEKAWGWKITYNKQEKTLIADENKDFCVCPLLKHDKNKNTAALCYCSEGFAELMFSVVAGSEVSARVISSVRRGDQSCRYHIEIHNS